MQKNQTTQKLSSTPSLLIKLRQQALTADLESAARAPTQAPTSQSILQKRTFAQTIHQRVTPQKLELEEDTGDMELPQFACQFENCGMTFQRRSGLVAHEQLEHAVTTMMGAVGSTEKVYQCQFPGCRKVFNQRQNLRVHMAIHLQKKEFVCTWPDCQKSFVTKGNLKDHIRRHNNDK